MVSRSQSLKATIPKMMLVCKAKLCEAWLREQRENIPDDEKLKFTNPWIRDRMKEFGV